jgi:hypothetical protein
MSEAEEMGDAALLVQVVSVPDGDAEELSDLVALLREDLLDLDVASVEQVRSGEAPAGNKGGLAVVAGWLAVNLGPSALNLVVERVAAWAKRNNHTVEISLGGDVLKVAGASQDQQERLIDAFIARHTASA